MSDRPTEMYRNGRPIDPDFLPTEKIYRWFTKEQVVGNCVPAASFKFPDCSVNRSKYGPAEWVIIDCPKRGIAAVQVQYVPVVLLAGDGRQFEFQVTHVPCEDNYPHSEIRVFLEKSHYQRDVPQGVKKAFRLKIARIGQVQIVKDSEE